MFHFTVVLLLGHAFTSSFTRNMSMQQITRFIFPPFKCNRHKLSILQQEAHMWICLAFQVCFFNRFIVVTLCPTQHTLLLETFFNTATACSFCQVISFQQGGTANPNAPLHCRTENSSARRPFPNACCHGNIGLISSR